MKEKDGEGYSIKLRGLSSLFPSLSLSLLGSSRFILDNRAGCVFKSRHIERGTRDKMDAESETKALVSPPDEPVEKDE